MLSLEEYGKSRYMSETVSKLLTEALENRSAEHVLNQRVQDMCKGEY